MVWQGVIACWRSEGLCGNSGSNQHWADSLVAYYPHRIKTTSEVPDAVSIYRKLLNESPDKSVTIVTVGFFLTNLSNLLKSEADDISPMNGTRARQPEGQQVCSHGRSFP